MSKPNIGVMIESPISSPRSRDILSMIVGPLKDEGFNVEVVSCLPGEPNNTKKGASKKEIKDNAERAKQIRKFDYTMLVGNTPLAMGLDLTGISKRRGKPLERGGKFFLPVNNPAIARHDPRQGALLEKDLATFKEMIAFGGIPEERDLNIRLVLTQEDVEEMLLDLYGTISFDIETNSLYPWQKYVVKKRKGQPDQWIEEPAKVQSIGFGTARAQWIIPVHHHQSPWEHDEIQDIVDRCTDIVEDCFMVMHNGKFDILWMWVHYGVRWHLDFDTMLAHYMLDENDLHGLKYLAQMYFGAPDWEIDLDSKQGRSTLKKLAKYHAHDLYYTRLLRYAIGKELRKDKEVKQVFDYIMMPCARMFVEIEMNGVFIDESKFDDAEAFLREEYDKALAELKKYEPDYVVNAKGKREPFNWGSTKQLGQLLFEDLGIPVVEYTDAGNYSCSESVIKRIDHPCAGALLRFRAAKQQLSFFIDGWKPFLHRMPNGDVYLHPSFKLHGTVTGRLSCEHPNLQQVPRDKRIRTLISAPKGWTLVECDLSQIELRVAAELANERSMLYAFANGIDVHWLTAIQEIERGGALKELVLDTARTWKQDKTLNYSQSIKVLLEMGPDEAVAIRPEWKEYRKKAKAVNFGYLYGMWWKKFKMYARDNYGVDVTDEEAQDSRVAFFDNYKDYPAWHDRQKRYARKHGYVKSLSGRKRRLPAAMSAEDGPERREAERQAINSPVQSFANELNLMAALQLRKEYGRKVVRICGTVHDAILVRVRDDYVEEVYNRLREIMSHPELMDILQIDVAVPIIADGSIGPWGAGVSLDVWKQQQKERKAA